MYCHLGQDIHKLRQRNRDLLQELESNSELLENKLKKLRDTAKTERFSDKSGTDIPPSPLKRKHESWKAPSSSAPPSNVHVNTFGPDQENIKPLANSPHKRSKRSITIVSGLEKKNYHSRCLEPYIPSQRNPKCYCPDKSIDAKSRKVGSKFIVCRGYCRNRNKINDLASQKSLKDKYNMSGKKHVSSQASKIAEDVHFTSPCSSPENVRNLEEVNSVINYSPESVFLKRLKKRFELFQASQGGVLSEEELSNGVKENQMDGQRNERNENSQSVSGRKDGKAPTRQIPKRKLCSCHHKRGSAKVKPTTGKLADSEACTCGNQINTTVNSAKGGVVPSSSDVADISAKPFRECNMRMMENVRHHTCSCGCTGAASTTASYREHIPSDKAFVCICKRKGGTSCRCTQVPSSIHCPCKACRYRNMQKILLGPEAVSVYSDSEMGCCSARARFNELKRFRHKYWCECHAHDHSPPEPLFSPDVGTDLFQLEQPPPVEKCLQRFDVGNNVFIMQGYGVCQNGTCRAVDAPHEEQTHCHSPGLPTKETAVKSRPKMNRITLPSKLQSQQTGRCSPRKKVVNKLSKGRTKGDKIGVKQQPTFVIPRTSPIKYKLPVPSNSFALRYQKGVA